VKAKDLAAFLLKHPEAVVVLDDTTTEWYATLKTGTVFNEGTIVSLTFNGEDMYRLEEDTTLIRTTDHPD